MSDNPETPVAPGAELPLPPEVQPFEETEMAKVRDLVAKANQPVLYDPNNWYWFMGNDNSRVWSSAKVDFLPLNDPDYVAWKEHNATPQMSWASLYQLMQNRPEALEWIARNRTADLSPEQATAALLQAGLEIRSTSNPDLNGTYSIDTATQQRIGSIVQSLSANLGFPKGLTELPWPDIQGVMHNFNQEHFMNFAAAVRDYVYDLYSIGQPGAVIPGQPVTLP